MVELFFEFRKDIQGVEINTTLRVSMWLETEESYLMPCQFVEVSEEKNIYTIKVIALDPNGFIEKKYLGETFLFGHLKKIVGHGKLIRIENVHKN